MAFEGQDVARIQVLHSELPFSSSEDHGPFVHGCLRSVPPEVIDQVARANHFVDACPQGAGSGTAPDLAGRGTRGTCTRSIHDSICATMDWRGCGFRGPGRTRSRHAASRGAEAESLPHAAETLGVHPSGLVFQVGTWDWKRTLRWFGGAGKSGTPSLLTHGMVCIFSQGPLPRA